MTRFALVVAIVLTLGSGSTSLARTFDSARCHVSFDVPRGWVVTVDTNVQDAECSIAVDPPDAKKRTADMDGLNVYGFTVDVVAGRFEEAVINDGGFEQENGDWYVLGRQGMRTRAVPVRGKGWRGVRGTATTGCFHEGGGYAGLCDVEAAFIGNDHWSVSMYARPQSYREFARALATLRFK